LASGTVATPKPVAGKPFLFALPHWVFSDRSFRRVGFDVEGKGLCRREGLETLRPAKHLTVSHVSTYETTKLACCTFTRAGQPDEAPLC
jgi:hypothetical protein